ncbi:hypothetical protein NHH73_18960 [Oxalobacteraceae bacterium OTU3CINTB1]|nr:hypothetical protein NHH73_18960 [Oxalobacteraceae bacterium OTU3CINTB1]
MSNDNHQQSVGGSGATDGLSGTENPGTEGADSGQGVNKGAEKTAGKGRHGHGGQHSGGMGGEHGGDLHDVGLAQSGMTGGSGSGGNTTKKGDKKNQPTP